MTRNTQTLLTYNNPKIVKGGKEGYLSAILHLAPHTLSGYNVCPFASPGCSSACLNTAGRGRMNQTQTARINKTLFFMEEREEFMGRLIKEITLHIKRAEKKGLTPCLRLNGTSDILWERILHEEKTLMEHFPSLIFYDYTAIPKRTTPNNYSLTFSRKENNHERCLEELSRGVNVAMVFDTIPEEYQGYRVINGDDNDLRFTDPSPVIVGLKAKGKAKKDMSGFVIRTSL